MPPLIDQAFVILVGRHACSANCSHEFVAFVETNPYSVFAGSQGNEAFPSSSFSLRPKLNGKWTAVEVDTIVYRHFIVCPIKVQRDIV